MTAAERDAVVVGATGNSSGARVDAIRGLGATEPRVLNVRARAGKRERANRYAVCTRAGNARGCREENCRCSAAECASEIGVDNAAAVIR